jgi:DNA polymerase-3 subunit delta
VIRTGKIPLAELLDLAHTLPLMHGPRVIVLRDLHHLDLPREGIKDLQAYLDDPAPETVLVMRVAKLDRRRQPDKMLCARGTLLEFHRPAEWEMTRWIRDRAAERGVRLSPEAAEALALLAGTDTSRVVNELEKLSLASLDPDKPVDLDRLDAVVGPGRATGAFELNDALLDRHPDRAVSVIRRTLRQGGQPRELLPLLLWQTARTVRQILLTREAAGRGIEGEEDVARELGVHPFVGRKLARSRSRFRHTNLGRALRTVHQVDRQLKSSHPCPEAVLDRLILRITGAARPPAGKARS